MGDWPVPGTIGLGLVVVTVGFLIAYLSNATRLMKRIDELTNKVFTLQDEMITLNKERSELKSELALALGRIRQLETTVGVPTVPPLGDIIVADSEGVIKAYGPGLVAILRYFPEEVLEKHIAMLIPAEIQEDHRRSFNRACADLSNIDPHKEILTFALAKGGIRVPVAITHRGWLMGNDGMITATIRQRAVAV